MKAEGENELEEREVRRGDTQSEGGGCYFYYIMNEVRSRRFAGGVLCFLLGCPLGAHKPKILPQTLKHDAHIMNAKRMH